MIANKARHQQLLPKQLILTIITCFFISGIAFAFISHQKSTIELQSLNRPVQLLRTAGIFKFPIDTTGLRTAKISSFLGKAEVGQFNFAEVGNDSLKMITLTNFRLVIWKWQYFINATILDLKGHVLVRVKNNSWKIDPVFVKKYNYDENGFELYDESDRIAFSIDFTRKMSNGISPALHIQGIIPRNRDTLDYFQNNTNLYRDVQFGTPQLNAAFYKQYDLYPILPLFRYSGKDWEHARIK